MIGNARKGVRWGLRVANLSPLASGSGGTGLRHLLCPHYRPELDSRSPASLSGERSPLRSTLALQREESLENPQKRELWERWRCIYSPAPRAQEGLFLSGNSRAWSGAAASPSGCPRRRAGRVRGLKSQASLQALELRRQYFKNLSVPPPSSRRHPRPPGPAPSVHCRVSDRDSEERGGGGGGVWESAPGSRRVWGKLKSLGET